MRMEDGGRGEVGEWRDAGEMVEVESWASHILGESSITE